MLEIYLEYILLAMHARTKATAALHPHFLLCIQIPAEVLKLEIKTT